MELCQRPQGSYGNVTALETWFRAATFRVLLHDVRVFSKIFQIFSFCLSSTDEVVDETSFEVFAVVC